MTGRRADMLNAIVACLNRAGEKGMTRREIASCLGIKVTPYLLELLVTVEQSGYATRIWDDHMRHAGYRYFPAQPEKA